MNKAQKLLELLLGEQAFKRRVLMDKLEAQEDPLHRELIKIFLYRDSQEMNHWKSEVVYKHVYPFMKRHAKKQGLLDFEDYFQVLFIQPFTDKTSYTKRYSYVYRPLQVTVNAIFNNLVGKTGAYKKIPYSIENLMQFIEEADAFICHMLAGSSDDVEDLYPKIDELLTKYPVEIMN